MEAPGQAFEKKPIIFPKVPVYVKGPVAPLRQEWADIVDAYESNPTSLRTAWLYLGHHPAFWAISERAGGFHIASGSGWYRSIELGVNEDSTVWIEIQPTPWPDDPESGDHGIEVESTTYEVAVATAACLVHESYRNDREFLKPPLTEKWYG